MKKTNEWQELIDHRPGWVIRWGNAIFILILGSTLALTLLIRYPDITKGTLVMHHSPHEGWYGALETSSTGLNTLVKGQPLTIRIATYPADTDGYLASPAHPLLDSLSGKKGWGAAIMLPHDLRMKDGRKLAYSVGMKLDAEILVGNRSLFQRVWQQLSFQPRLP